MPMYIYRSIYGNAQLASPTVHIKGYGDNPVKNIGSCMASLLTGRADGAVNINGQTHKLPIAKDM